MAYTPGDGLGYWLGLASGMLMLTLFAYPMRKHMRCLRCAGHVRCWFCVHMWTAIVATALAVAHSKLELRSANASLAFWGMLALTGSGLVGRYLGTRAKKLLHVWHVVHVPLSYLLALVVVAHVVAVHMY